MQTGYHGLNRSSLILLELIDKLTLMNSSEHLMYHMLVLKLCVTINDIIVLFLVTSQLSLLNVFFIYLILTTVGLLA